MQRCCAARDSRAGRAGRAQSGGPHTRLRITITRGNPMAIELDKDVRDRAIASLQRYFTENMDEPIGNIQAGALLHFFVEEIAPAIYNLAIADAQERLHARVAELDIECHAEPFEYWKKQPGRKR
ncbi:hypothetical protein Bamb_0838 [Burkholderia ambifaria AMMD]|uniref:DUF2164 domain-containing protein n=4 Tax=Burkholderia ambifaria TaxID=152480 RepID=Q0BHH6_BURCM|nr:hypothetical protein Bamb_0838 [Burkholderia ambifaria AMMD]